MAALIGVLALLTLALAVFLPYGSAKRRSESAGSADAVVSAGAESLTSVQLAPSAIKKVPFITASRCAETREEGAHRIDVNGDEHRPLAHIVRSTQKLLGDYKIEHAVRHEHEVLAGRSGSPR